VRREGGRSVGQLQGRQRAASPPQAPNCAGPNVPRQRPARACNSRRTSSAWSCSSARPARSSAAARAGPSPRARAARAARTRRAHSARAACGDAPHAAATSDGVALRGWGCGMGSPNCGGWERRSGNRGKLAQDPGRAAAGARERTAPGSGTHASRRSSRGPAAASARGRPLPPLLPSDGPLSSERAGPAPVAPRSDSSHGAAAAHAPLAAAAAQCARSSDRAAAAWRRARRAASRAWRDGWGCASGKTRRMAGGAGGGLQPLGRARRGEASTARSPLSRQPRGRLAPRTRRLPRPRPLARTRALSGAALSCPWRAPRGRRRAGGPRAHGLLPGGPRGSGASRCAHRGAGGRLAGAAPRARHKSSISVPASEFGRVAPADKEYMFRARGGAVGRRFRPRAGRVSAVTPPLCPQGESHFAPR
jgi:hypothetical protein